MGFEPKFMYVEIPVTIEDIAVIGEPSTYEFRPATNEERGQQGVEAMEWMASLGHFCNPSCNPPFSHTSAATHTEITKYLSEALYR